MVPCEQAPGNSGGGGGKSFLTGRNLWQKPAQGGEKRE